MQIVPAQAVPNQSFQVQLASQSCTLDVYQYAYGLFMDVLVNNEVIIGGVICLNLNRIVRNQYLGFIGDFTWFDTQGKTDPVYTGIGSRYQLVYLEAADIEQQPTGAAGTPVVPPPEPTFYVTEDSSTFFVSE